MVAEGQVERVGDRVGKPVLQEVLAVAAAQVGLHVAQRPVPVDAGTPSWQRSAREVWASALACRKNRSAPLAIR